MALWVSVPDDDEDFDHNHKTFGYVLTHVDDFLIVAPKDHRNDIEEGISRTWAIKVIGDVSRFDSQNPDESLTFFSTVIRSHTEVGGFSLSQEPFIRGILKTWEMSECRLLPTPGDQDSAVLLPVDGIPEELDPHDIFRAQKLAGS